MMKININHSTAWNQKPDLKFSLVFCIETENTFIINSVYQNFSVEKKIQTAATEVFGRQNAVFCNCKTTTKIPIFHNSTYKKYERMFQHWM